MVIPMDSITLSWDDGEGDLFDFDIGLPDDLMIRLIWWIDSHGFTLTC
jgi:hypothetical protein